MQEVLAGTDSVAFDPAGGLRSAVDSLAGALTDVSGSLAALESAESGLPWATILQVLATAVAAFAAWQSWRSAEQSEKTGRRAERNDQAERDWRQRGIRHVYYAATVRTPVHEAARVFRAEAKAYFRDVVREFEGLGGQTSDAVNDRAFAVLNAYLSERHQPFADAVTEAAAAWDESPGLARGLQEACGVLEEEVSEECSKLPSRGLDYTFAAAIDQGVGKVLRLVKEADPALAPEPEPEAT